jgi:hypothetical protein
VKRRLKWSSLTLLLSHQEGFLVAEGLTQTEVNRLNEAKSFDVLASVSMYRNDLANFNQILPETRQRVYDEELTYIAEGINKPLTTQFNLKKENGHLLFFDRGSWQPYVGTLIKGLDSAKHEAQADPRKTFMAERAADDLLTGYKLQDLHPGQTLSWYSAFPARERELYGDEFLGQLGFQPKREMGFLYRAEATDDGINLITQSVDNSDDEAFQAAWLFGEAGGSLEDMTAAYDHVLAAKHGQGFKAGRRADEQVPEENAWHIVVKHRDLIEDYFLNEIEDLAKRNLPEEELERHKKRLTYGVWAALKNRLNDSSLTNLQATGGGFPVQQEVGAAYSAAAARGEVLFGCGGSITGENAILSANPSAVHTSIFGGEKKWMSCPYCGGRQFGDPCAAVLECGRCQARVENGKIQSYGNVYRKAAKGIIEIAAEEFAKWNREYEIKKAEAELARVA